MIKKMEPLRMCVICRNMLPKSELVRVVKNSEGDIFVDETRKANGRGAWLCKTPACLAKLKKNKPFHRAFSGNVSEEVYEKVIEVAGAEQKPTN